MTEVRYDAEGRVAGWVTTEEAEFTPSEAALLLASREDELMRGPHGYLMSEAMDPKNQFAFYGPEAPDVDFAEKARKDAMDAYYKKHDTKENPVNRNGHLWPVFKRASGTRR